MRTNGKKLAVPLGTTVLAMGVLAGCGSSAPETTVAGTATPMTEVGTGAESSAASGGTEDTEAAKAENVLSTDLSGTISMVESTSIERFANVLSGSFMEKHSGVTVTAEFVGSGAGVKVVNNGTADIGNSPRNLKDEEKADGVVEDIVAIDGITVVIDAVSTVEDLTRQQPSDIYEGKITSWKDAGGNDAPIVVVGCEPNSGIRSTFEELLELEDVCKHNNELDSAGTMMIKVASTLGAIDYVPLDILDDTVKAAKLEGAKPTGENIKVGSYFLNRPFVMVTKGEISEQNDFVRALFDYIYLEEGAGIVKSVGLVAIGK